MVKESVYQTPINSREDLEDRTTVACRSVMSAMVMRVRGSSGTALTHLKEVAGSIFKISLIDSLNFYDLFVIKTCFSLVFQLLLSMSKNENDND
jgi:hypothetical protein